MNQQEIANNHEKLRAVLEENGELDQNSIYGPNWVLIQPTQEALEARSESSYFHTDNKICQICKIEFDYGRNNLTNCGEHTFYCICAVCENVFPRSVIGKIKESIIKLSPVTAYCSRGCANVTVQESIRRRRAEDPEYNAQYLSRIRETAKLGQSALDYLRKNNPKWAAKMSEISAENLKHANAALANLRKNDPEWVAKMSKINAKNIKYAHAALDDLRKNDPKWREFMREILAENGKKTGPENAKYTNAARLEALIARFDLANISFDGQSLTYSDAASYRDVVGAIGLTGVYKGGKPGIPNSDIGTRFALTAGMRSNLGEEIRTFASILAQPEKQISAADELALPNLPSSPDFGRWYDITHYYEGFELSLIHI